MREGDIIARFFAPLTEGEPGSFLLTDDAAVLAPPPGKQLVVTTDSVMQGVHVLPDATPAQYAQKLLRRNLSDLAAMGAQPWRYMLNLTLSPAADESWLAAFSAMLREEQELFGCVLVGGDTTRHDGPIHLTLTAFGLADTVLRRNGAQVGDDLYVSGTIGDAALGLCLLRQGIHHDAFLQDRYHVPQPRLALGQALGGMATAALDASDGLVKDTARLAQASGVGVVIERARVPLSAAAKALQTLPDFWHSILNGGDDYELIFTAPPSQRETLARLDVTRVGHVTAGSGVRVMDGVAEVTPTRDGWEY